MRTTATTQSVSQQHTQYIVTPSTATQETDVLASTYHQQPYSQPTLDVNSTWNSSDVLMVSPASDMTHSPSSGVSEHFPPVYNRSYAFSDQTTAFLEPQMAFSYTFESTDSLSDSGFPSDNFQAATPQSLTATVSPLSSMMSPQEVLKPFPATAGRGHEQFSAVSPADDSLPTHASPESLTISSSFRMKKARDMQNPRNAHRKQIEEKCNQRRKEAQDRFSAALKERGHELKTAAQQFEAAADLIVNDGKKLVQYDNMVQAMSLELKRLKEENAKLREEHGMARKGSRSVAQQPVVRAHV